MPHVSMGPIQVCGKRSATQEPSLPWLFPSCQPLPPGSNSRRWSPTTGIMVPSLQKAGTFHACISRLGMLGSLGCAVRCLAQCWSVGCLRIPQDLSLLRGSWWAHIACPSCGGRPVAFMRWPFVGAGFGDMRR